jgi:aminoglycoside/choline kinase family phosphotransferase
MSLLLNWLATLDPNIGLQIESLAPASSDASFRRYFRIQAHLGTLVVMDAPPPQENCRPFVDIAARLANVKLNVPEIRAQDLEQGFLLLSDLGPTTYYAKIQQGLTEAELQPLYRDALVALVQLQTASHSGLPTYDAKRLKDELGLFIEWYVSVHCKTQLEPAVLSQLDQVFDQLVTHNAAQPIVLVHRDFHSPNLMLSEGGQHGVNPGVLDFQDAVAGPITYDLASLVVDARTTWEEPQQIDWAIRYWELARKQGLPVPTDFADFHRDYEWMGLQRHLKVAGIFARLTLRDGKAQYLADTPRFIAYVRQSASRYRLLAPLLRLLEQIEGGALQAGYTF